MRIEMIPINDVTEYATNPRRNEAAVGAVAESIRTFGFIHGLSALTMRARRSSSGGPSRGPFGSIRAIAKGR